MEMMMSPEEEQAASEDVEFYCPHCAIAVKDPLTCGDCGSLICRRCGMPVERISELGIG
jgi:primosomal protein N'